MLPAPGQLLMGVDGYTFGLEGAPGEYMWAGASRTFFGIDSKQKLAVVAMSQVPGPIRPYYRRLIKEMVSSSVMATSAVER